jgi:protein-tyrosine phosphatase
VLVSLLGRDEERELGLEQEAAISDTNGIEFVALAMPDLGTPPHSEEFVQSVAKLVTLLRGGKRIAVHCRQSVGRSGLLVVSMAVAAGIPLEAAIEAVSVARGVRVPETPVQLAWLRQHRGQLSALAG